MRVNAFRATGSSGSGGDLREVWWIRVFFGLQRSLGFRV